MKTNQKKEYVAPRLDVILVELEEGIAQTSGVDAGSNPSSNPWTEGDGGGGNWEGN
ncbi:hypothetical protein [Sphingobacterium sp. SGR-19]|uniref:hypothetical protein n=1 Tax=Sphingobacterium sp. SGR-19 TaxID=2710886 RepID=UPI0013ED4DE3|nr:hypothetical protein [Sphingobacterium sp. SGR-19]